MYFHLSPHTTVAALAADWLQHLRDEHRLEGTTIHEYERVLRKLVVPRLGGVSIRELTTDQVNVVLAELGAQSHNRQRKAKVILGAMLDAAVEYGALSKNPVRGSLSISRPRPDFRSLTPAEIEAVRAAVSVWLNKNRPGPRSSADMADIVELMMTTGARIGEVLALRWRDIDPDARVVEVNGTIKTEPGIGTYRKLLPRRRVIDLPESAMLVLDARRRRVTDNFLDAVFPTRNVTWQQVNNVERRWRQIRKEAGLEWVTPDAFRGLLSP